MRALVSLHVEILDGPDRRYILDEQARCVDLGRVCPKFEKGHINPYRISLEFVTPSVFEEAKTGCPLDHIEYLDFPASKPENKNI